MKTTMKDYEYLNKLVCCTRKITMTLLMASLVLVFASCEKEGLENPIQEETLADKKVDAKADPNASFTRFRYVMNKLRNIAEYEELEQNSTVKFRGQFWSIVGKGTPGARMGSYIYSSIDGKSWRLRRTDTFPGLWRHGVVVYNDKIWVIDGKSHRADGESDYERQIWNSTNGLDWELVTTETPFSNIADSGAIVYNDRMFVFESVNDGMYRYGNQKVHSSTDGINWVLENSNAFPHLSGGRSIVFEDDIYYIGGWSSFGNISNEIWKSSDGRNWVHVRGWGLETDRERPLFPERASHAVAVYDGKVWVSGGIDDIGRNNDVWYSSNMEDWFKIFGGPELPQMYNHTLIEHNHKLLVVGGRYNAGDSKIKDIRSIRKVLY